MQKILLAGLPAVWSINIHRMDLGTSDFKVKFLVQSFNRFKAVCSIMRSWQLEFYTRAAYALNFHVTVNDTRHILFNKIYFAYSMEKMNPTFCKHLRQGRICIISPKICYYRLCDLLRPNQRWYVPRMAKNLPPGTRNQRNVQKWIFFWNSSD